MTSQIRCADIVRLRRYDAVCVAARQGAPVLCFFVPDTETTRHRADISLSMCESAEAGLPPDRRVRCVGRTHGGGGQVVGRMPAPAMQRIHGMLAQEMARQAGEQEHDRGRPARR